MSTQGKEPMVQVNSWSTTLPCRLAHGKWQAESVPVVCGWRSVGATPRRDDNWARTLSPRGNAAGCLTSVPRDKNRKSGRSPVRRLGGRQPMAGSHVDCISRNISPGCLSSVTGQSVHSWGRRGKILSDEIEQPGRRASYCTVRSPRQAIPPSRQPGDWTRISHDPDSPCVHAALLPLQLYRR